MKKMIQQLLMSAVLATTMAAAHATIITSTADVALTGATLETFDGVASGDYASLALTGVTIVGNGSPMTVDSTYSSAYGIGGQSLHNSSSSPTSFDLIFSSSVSAFGIWGGAVNNSWTYSAYDSANTLIESITTSGACCGPMFYGIAANGISKVTLSGFGDWVIFDNLYFSTAEVPEPTSLALIGLALTGLAASRKRKTVA